MHEFFAEAQITMCTKRRKSTKLLADPVKGISAWFKECVRQQVEATGLHQNLVQGAEKTRRKVVTDRAHRAIADKRLARGMKRTIKLT